MIDTAKRRNLRGYASSNDLTDCTSEEKKSGKIHKMPEKTISIVYEEFTSPTDDIKS